MPTPHDATRPTRWGIIGAGRIAATVGADIQASPDHEIVAIGARDAGRARDFADRLGIPSAYGSYSQLLADERVDVVYVASTHAQHHEQALLALSAGKPVLVEKAFTLNAREGREVAALAAERDLFCMEAMWMRCNPLVRRAREIVHSGRLGTVLSVTVDHGQRFPFDATNRLFDLAVGGGALLDLGVYSATFAWMFLGRPSAVVATGALSPTGSDLTTAMQWSYPDDRFAHVSCTTESATPCQGLVVGTHGWLSLGTPFYAPGTMTVSTADGVETTSGSVPGNGYQPQLDEVRRCLLAGLSQSPLIPLADTLGVLELMDGARASVGVRYPADD